MPEDRRYLDAPAPALDEVLPALARWLKKVFIVMGGYMAATGVLTINLAVTEVRAGSITALVIVAFAGGSSVGLMAVVNIVLRSDFRWPLLGLAALWAASVTLAACGT